MHRTDGSGHVANAFDDGDPGVPTLGTQVEEHWLNAVQEELANAIEGAGITLVKDTNTQLKAAMGMGAAPAEGARAFADKLTIDTVAGVTEAVDIQAEHASVAAVKVTQFGNAPCLELVGKDGKSPLRLAALTTLPTSGQVAGDIVFLAGAYNKLYCWDGSAWNACW